MLAARRTVARPFRSSPPVNSAPARTRRRSASGRGAPRGGPVPPEPAGEQRTRANKETIGERPRDLGTLRPPDLRECVVRHGERQLVVSNRSTLPLIGWGTRTRGEVAPRGDRRGKHDEGGEREEGSDVAHGGGTIAGSRRKRTSRIGRPAPRRPHPTQQRRARP